MSSSLTPQVISLAAGIFSAIMLLITIRMLRRETRVSRLAPFIAIGTTLLSTFFYLVITNAPVNSILVWVFLGLGFLVGLMQGQSTKIYYRGNAIFGKRSAAYLVLWGLAYLVSLALVHLGNAALHAFAILGMVFGVGTTVGANLNLFVRQVFLRPQSALPTQSRPMSTNNLPRTPTNLPQ